MQNQENTIEQEILAILKEYPKILEYWQKISPSHKKEYIKWIAEAKKEETKQKRKEKTVEMLLEKYS